MHGPPDALQIWLASWTRSRLMLAPAKNLLIRRSAAMF